VRSALVRLCCVLAALAASVGGLLTVGAAAFLTSTGAAYGQVSVSNLSAPASPAAAGSAGKVTITWSAATIGSSLAAAASYTVERYSTSGTALGAASCGSVPSSSGNPNSFGSFSCVDTPSAGTYKYVITALYGGTSWSTPSGFTNTASPGTTTTAVSSSANPSNAGKLVTYTATVTPSPGGTVTGNVEFLDGGTAISGCTSQALSSGQATCQVTYTTVATHTITAGYLGSTAYATSTSSSLTETISKAAPTLAAAGPSTGTPGTTISASAITATLASSSGTNAVGTVTFTVFGPQTTAPTTCTTGGTSLGTASVSGNGSHNPSSSFTPSADGNYWLYASYAGDTNNSAANSACPPTAEVVVSGKASDTLSLNPPDTGVQGTAIAASSIIATLAGVSGSNASGTITYKVFGPQTTAPTTCTTGGTTVGTSTVSGAGNYTPSAGYTPTSTGTYWWYSSYAGDTNNAASNSGCGSSMQSTVVTLPQTTLALTAPGSAMVNATIAASSVDATLSGATSTAGGTVTITVFGPQATAPTTCTSGGTVVSTSTVSGNGAYNPASGETVPAVGDYWLYASYSGDANNGASNSGCGTGMTEVSIFSATSAGSTNDTSLDATTTLSFTMAPSTTYVLFVLRHSAAGDSISSIGSSGVSSSLSLTSVASQTYNTTGYQWAYWFTSPSSSSGSETLTIHFAKTLTSGQITIVDLAQLGGVDTTNPIVSATKATTNGSSATAAANLASAPASGDAQLVFLNGQDNLGGATPSASPTMTNFFSTEQTAGSGAAYINAPATQNESFSLGASHHWGTIALELNNG
jgi:Bacterial Ig-like domain (group 3)